MPFLESVLPGGSAVALGNVAALALWGLAGVAINLAPKMH